MGSRMGDIWRSGSWLSCPSASFLLGQRSEHLDRLFHSVRFDALYPSPTHPPIVLLVASTLGGNYAEAVVRN